MAINNGAVVKNGTAYRQITVFDISGNPGDLPGAYNVKLMVKDFDKFDDGIVLETGSKRYAFNVGGLIVDDEDVVIPEREKLLEDFVSLFYEEIAKQDALEV
jgi:hypothetical protein